MEEKKLKKIDILRITGACGILIPIIFFTSTGLAISQSPWFKWTHHALSDLGIDGISAFLFNNGVIITGILALIFSLGLTKTLSNKIGGHILIFSSLNLLGIGIFPIPVGPIHFFVSATFFISLTIGLLTFGFTLKKDQFERKMATLAIVIFCIAIFSPPLLLLGNGLAIPETIIFLPTFIWCMIYGVKILLFHKITNKPKIPAITG